MRMVTDTQSGTQFVLGSWERWDRSPSLSGRLFSITAIFAPSSGIPSLGTKLGPGAKILFKDPEIPRGQPHLLGPVPLAPEATPAGVKKQRELHAHRCGWVPSPTVASDPSPRPPSLPPPPQRPHLTHRRVAKQRPRLLGGLRLRADYTSQRPLRALPVSPLGPDPRAVAGGLGVRA